MTNTAPQNPVDYETLIGTYLYHLVSPQTKAQVDVYPFKDGVVLDIQKHTEAKQVVHPRAATYVRAALKNIGITFDKTSMDFSNANGEKPAFSLRGAMLDNTMMIFRNRTVIVKNFAESKWSMAAVDNDKKEMQLLINRLNYAESIKGDAQYAKRPK